MSGALDYLDAAASVAAIAACAYVLYQSLLVRKTLAVGPYRMHALGMGFVAGLFALNQVSSFLPTEGVWSFLGLGFFLVFGLGILYWVDTSIIASRRSDPLYRDTFRWSAARRIIWATAVAGFSVNVIIGLVLPPEAGNSIPDWVGLVLYALFLFPIYSGAISAVAVIPVAARRCKDLVFRKHLEYFFIFIAIELVIAGVIGPFFQNPNGNATSMSQIIDAIGVLIGFYPLLVSVRRLVPLYRFGDEGPAEGEQTAPPLLGKWNPISEQKSGHL